jgi:hypothetical protein
MGADLAERRFIAGIVSHYRGKSEEAKRLLLEACTERSDWVAPRAFLAAVCNLTEDWAGLISEGNKAMELTPLSAEDYLFRGYMIGLTNPQRGLLDIEKGVALRRSILALFIRAEGLLWLADDTGRIDHIVAARDGLRDVRAFLGDAPFITVTGLLINCVGCNNSRLHKLPEHVARQWLDEGAADYRAAGLGACRTHPFSLWARGQFLHLRDGFSDNIEHRALDKESREAGRRGAESSACSMHLTNLFRHGNGDEALDYLGGIPPNGSYMLTFYKTIFLVGKDQRLAQEQCRLAYAENPEWRDREYLIWATSLAGMPHEARRAAKAYRTTPATWPEWSKQGHFLKRVFAHAYENEPMDLEQEANGSRWSLVSGYNTLGFAAIGRGDRQQAIEYFRKSDEHCPVGLGDFLWSRAIRQRIINDPNWPVWLKNSKKP